MKANYENSISMMLATDKVLSVFMTIWQNVIKFAGTVSRYRDILTSIDDRRQILEKQIKAVTVDKAAKKKTMCQEALAVAGIVFAYARSISDVQLQGLVNFSYSKLTHVRDTVSYERCLFIYNTAFPIASLLTDFGLESNMLPEFKSAIEAYFEVMSEPRISLGDRKIAGKNVKELVREASDILEKEIDKMMMKYSITKPEFYDKYKSARMIIDLGHRAKKPVSTIRGITMDFITEQVLGGVHVWLEDGSSEIYSDAMGKYELPVYKAGTVCILAEKTNYNRSEEDWDVANGTDYEINIDMEPIEPVMVPEETL